MNGNWRVGRPLLLPARSHSPHAEDMANLLTNVKAKRRWMQVSLRTVLVLVTLLCVALSVWVMPAARRRRAVAAIEKLGGMVGYVKPAASETFPVAHLRRWLPPAYFDEIEWVDLNNTQVTDAGFAHLQGMTSLQWLDLDNTSVSDAGLGPNEQSLWSSADIC